MKRTRHSRKSWIEAGLSALVADGPAALAAEPLARELGTTKGSFYWHFKDVPEFQSAVVKEWQSLAFAEVVSALADKGSAEDRLRRFGKSTLSAKYDRAVRAWAATNADVAKVVAQVDAERLAYVATLLRHLGVTNEDFARSCLAALIGLPSLSGRARAAKSFEALVDLVLALK